MIQCPRCGLQVTELHPVGPDLLAKVQPTGEPLPAQLCAACLSDLARASAAAPAPVGEGVLVAQERAKEQHRLQLWKSRVSLIKKARLCMGAKIYSDAAVAYEKYLKILEIVFEVKQGEKLTPQLFKESARTTELTVVASVYWDLLRIYDTNDKYADRQMIAAKQLALFIRFTPIYPDIIKKAEAFARGARNTQAVKYFLKQASDHRPRCFIATSAFESPTAPEVQILRFLRDSQLKNSFWGRRFIYFYYRHSPRIACLLDRHPWFKPAIRATLRLMIKCVS